MQNNDDLINEEVIQFVPRAAPVKHSMLRRNRDWHYCWAGVYMITLVLADRSHPILGRLQGDGDGAFIELSPMGLEVAKCWSLIKDFNPNLEPLDYVVMPDHFHGILRVKRRLERPMGEAIRGFKIGCTKAYRTIYGAVQEEQAPVPAHKCAGLWASGYQDSIAFNEQRLACMIAYIKDNPRRLAVKYVPGKKPLTRLDACVLNRLAQMICKDDAATINYHGMKPADIDGLVKVAMTPP